MTLIIPVGWQPPRRPLHTETRRRGRRSAPARLAGIGPRSRAPAWHDKFHRPAPRIARTRLPGRPRRRETAIPGRAPAGIAPRVSCVGPAPRSRTGIDTETEPPESAGAARRPIRDRAEDP